MLSFDEPKSAINCRGSNSAIRSAATPTAASQSTKRVRIPFARSKRFAPTLYPTIGIQPAAIPTTIEITIWKNFITMPTTAIGICANCSCPQTASSAPYLRTILLIAAIAATSEICDRKLQMPSRINCFITLPQSTKLSFCKATVFIRHR